MCYSAQVEQNLKRLQKLRKARVDLPAFEKLFRSRLEGAPHKIPKGMEANFYAPESVDEKRIEQLIAEYNDGRTRDLETELFKQKKRLADAERSLKLKITRAAQESRRIATSKVEWHLTKIADLKRTELNEEDSRIYPFYYAPLYVFEDGEYVIKPMRYHCRPNGKPERYDRDFDGLYNARRDNLEGFWKGQFGQTHGFAVISAFYENVARHDFERRELRLGEKPENLILGFKPSPPGLMTVACLWARWQQPSSADLDSFAAITDEPPPEISAAGHDRCIIPLSEEGLAVWSRPTSTDKAALHSALDNRWKPYYEHRLAA